MSQRKLQEKYCADGDSVKALPKAASFQMKHHFVSTIVSLKDIDMNGIAFNQSFILS